LPWIFLLTFAKHRTNSPEERSSNSIAEPAALIHVKSAHRVLEIAARWARRMRRLQEWWYWRGSGDEWGERPLRSSSSSR
jgi:hypothetical protein